MASSHAHGSEAGHHRGHPAHAHGTRPHGVGHEEPARSHAHEADPAPPEPIAVRLRRGREQDVAACARVCYDAFSHVSGAHGFPPDFPAVDVAAQLVGYVMTSEHVYSQVAEDDAGNVLGSGFLWTGGAIGGIGPVSVDPAAQGRSVGRAIMEALLERADGAAQLAGVRLVQAAFNTRSMALYTKLGFEVREPLVCIHGRPLGRMLPGFHVRPAVEADLPACAALCRRIHGHERTGDLRFGLVQHRALVVEHDGHITGYASEIGFMGHAVAMSNHELIALISAAEEFNGPGFLLPARNAEVFRWCLRHGLRVTQPLTLMARGLYNEPSGAFLAPILY